MRNAGRLKLGYYPLPSGEARNLRSLLIATQPFFGVDPCAGDGTALAEITRELPAQNAAIELDADRAAATAARGIATTHGSTFESHLPAGSCSLLYLNPPYDVEMGRHSNQRLELVFLDHCYGWLKTAGVLIFVIPEVALTPCAKRLASQFERISVFRLGHPDSARFHQLALIGIRKPEHKRGDTRSVDQLLRLAYQSARLPVLGPETAERYSVPPPVGVAVQYRGLPLEEIEDALVRSSAMQGALNLLIHKPESITGRPVTPLHGRDAERGVWRRSRATHRTLAFGKTRRCLPRGRRWISDRQASRKVQPRTDACLSEGTRGRAQIFGVLRRRGPTFAFI